MQSVELSYFAVKTEVFEGPMDLLIELVEKRKLLINDINLAEVTDEYMRRVSQMQERSLPNTAEFVRLAATLLLIKSKSLLPSLELTDEEETAIEDLEERLRYYQVYREGSLVLMRRFGEHIMFEPAYTPPKQPVFVPDKYCAKNELHDAINRVIKNLPKSTFKPEVKVQKSISLEEMIGDLKARIERQMRAKFSELRSYGTDRRTQAVCFLAVLELIKQGDIIVRQTTHFEDFDIEHTKNNTPRYY